MPHTDTKKSGTVFHCLPNRQHTRGQTKHAHAYDCLLIVFVCLLFAFEIRMLCFSFLLALPCLKSISICLFAYAKRTFSRIHSIWFAGTNFINVLWIHFVAISSHLLETPRHHRILYTESFEMTLSTDILDVGTFFKHRVYSTAKRSAPISDKA